MIATMTGFGEGEHHAHRDGDERDWAPPAQLEHRADDELALAWWEDVFHRGDDLDRARVQVAGEHDVLHPAGADDVGEPGRVQSAIEAEDAADSVECESEEDLDGGGELETHDDEERHRAVDVAKPRPRGR